MKKISIIVPFFNSEEYVDKCLDSLVNQTIGVDNLEVILINDASTDGGASSVIVRRYEARYPDSIILIELDTNMRQGGARNIGIQYASGEYIAFCDIDDWYELSAMELIYNAATQNNADVVEFCNQDVKSYDKGLLPIETGKPDGMVDIDSVEARKKWLFTYETTYGCWNKVYRASILKDNNIRYAEHLIYEEPSFTIPVRLYEKRHYFLNKILHRTYLSDNSTLRGRQEERAFDNAKAWIILLNDLINRGVMETYYSEIEYMFYSWFFESTIVFAISKNCYFNPEQIKVLQSNTNSLFPKASNNHYLAEEQRYITKWLFQEVTNDNIKEFYDDFTDLLYKRYVRCAE